jgi:iron-sulfur cluster repair protein YtfE (RIC family)
MERRLEENAIEFLTRQHSQVETMFSKLDEREDKMLENDIRGALEHHMRVEERIFYPALTRKEATKKFVKHAAEEHGDVKKLLSDLTFAHGKEWLDLMSELKDSVTHHVEEEESKMFPAVEKAFTPTELEILGQRMRFTG